MPAAHSSLLEQLGFSREVGVWLAVLVKEALSGDERERLHLGVGGQRAQEVSSYLGSRLGVTVKHYSDLLQSLLPQPTPHPKLAALQLSMSARNLQWLSSMPLDRLLSLQGGSLRLSWHMLR